MQYEGHYCIRTILCSRHLQRHYNNNLFPLAKRLHTGEEMEAWSRVFLQEGFAVAPTVTEFLFLFLRPFLCLTFLSYWLITYSILKHWNSFIFKKTIRWWCPSLRSLVHMFLPCIIEDVSCFLEQVRLPYPLVFPGSISREKNSLSKTMAITKNILSSDILLVFSHTVLCSPIEDESKCH